MVDKSIQQRTLVHLFIKPKIMFLVLNYQKHFEITIFFEMINKFFSYEIVNFKILTKSQNKDVIQLLCKNNAKFLS